MLPIDEGYKSSICEIKSMHNDLLTTARIYAITDDSVEFVHPEDDKMPMLPYNMPIKISVFNAKKGFRMLMGLVYISTDVFLRVSDVKSVQDFERRGFFRINVKTPTNIYPIMDGPQDNPEAMQPINVQLEDISLSGVQISTDLKLHLGDTFAVEIQLFKKKMLFHCRVARLAKTNVETNYYGCAFFDHTDRQMDDLCYDLFQLQRMEIKKKRT